MQQALGDQGIEYEVVTEPIYPRSRRNGGTINAGKPFEQAGGLRS